MRATIFLAVLALAASMREAALTRDESRGVASGTIEVARVAGETGPVAVVLQAWWVGADGTKVWAAPVDGEAR